MRTKRHLAGFAVVGATVLFAATAALGEAPDNYRINLNPADQSAARATVLRRADLAKLGGLELLPAEKWTGGMEKPDLSPDDSPPACNPKESDLVLTGAATSSFKNKRVGLAVMVTLGSEVRVLKTARMVRLDWERSINAPNLLTCGRQGLGRGLMKAFPAGTNPRLKSFKRLNYPLGMRYPTAFVAVVDLTIKGRKVSAAAEVLVQYKGRTEIHLFAGAFSTKPELAEAQVIFLIHQLTPILVGRVRA